MLGKRGIVFLLGILLALQFVMAYNYPSWGYGGWDVESFLDNPTFIFIGVFVLIFALVYIALGRFFSKKEKSMFPWDADKTVVENNGVLVVMALVIAFFSASAAVRSGWMMSFFGDVAFRFLLLMLFVVMVILAVSFYKALESNMGRTPAAILFILAIWGVIRYLFDPFRLRDFVGGFDISYLVYDIYDFASSVEVLGIALVIGIIYAFIRNLGDKRHGRRR